MLYSTLTLTLTNKIVSYIGWSRMSLITNSGTLKAIFIITPIVALDTFPLLCGNMLMVSFCKPPKWPPSQVLTTPGRAKVLSLVPDTATLLGNHER